LLVIVFTNECFEQILHVQPHLVVSANVEIGISLGHHLNQELSLALEHILYISLGSPSFIPGKGRVQLGQHLLVLHFSHEVPVDKVCVLVTAAEVHVRLGAGAFFALGYSKFLQKPNERNNTSARPDHEHGRSRLQVRGGHAEHGFFNEDFAGKRRLAFHDVHEVLRDEARAGA